MSTATVSRPVTDAIVADLLLVRMSLPDPTPKRVRQEIGKLLASEISQADFDNLRNQLESDGFLTKGHRKTLVLTDVGRERAFRFVGVAEFPPKTTWSTVIAKYLFPKAAAVSADAAANLNDCDKLSAFILKRKYRLAASAGSTVNQVIQAIACKELGFPEETTINGLLCAVLSRLVGSERLTKKQLIEQLPLYESGLTDATLDACRKLIVRNWLGSGSRTDEQAAEQLDLPEFAATVRALAANSPPEDRFHDNKVFIAALWRASQKEQSFPQFTLPVFKQLLIEANSCELLHLSRADFVQAMDPQLVADSETAYLNATFHFVLLDGDLQ